MTDLKNEFSWSWSRHRTFQDCKRRYWYNCHGFWGGWESSIDAETREIYLQKKLSTRPQWMGSVVHAAAEWILNRTRNGRCPQPDEAAHRFRTLAEDQVADSAAGRYRENPKRYPGLVEHYYALDVPRETWEASVGEIERQVRGLYENRVFLRLLRAPDRILEVEQVEQVLVDDVPVWVSLDVLVEDGSGGWVVIDWKTGSAHETGTVAAQLGVYGIYVLDRYAGVPPDRALPLPDGRMKALYANLRDGRHVVFDLDDESVAEAIDLVRTSSAAMRSLLEDPVANTARFERFPPRDLGDPACGECAFRRACGR